MVTLEPTAQLKGHKEAVLCLRHAKESFLGNRVLASGSEDKTCRIWDLRTNRVVKGIQKLDDAIASVAFATKADKPYLYLASGAKVYAYDLRNPSMILTEAIREYAFSGDEVNSIDVNEKNTFLVTGDDQGEVKVIDLERHQIHKKLTKRHANICIAVRFRPKKPWEVWSGGLDCNIFQWDFSLGKPMDIINTNPIEGSSPQIFNPPFVYSLQISADGQWIAAGLGDGSIQLQHQGPSKEKSKGKRTIGKRLYDGHNHLVNCLTFLDFAQEKKAYQLLSGSANGSIALWDLDDQADVINPVNRYLVDNSFVKLNWLESYASDERDVRFAAAGIAKGSDIGLVNIYSIV